MYTVIYGITTATDLYTSIYDEKENLIYASTFGNESYSKEVLSLEQLASIEKSSISKIIICSQYVNEIVNSLLAQNFSLNIIFFFNHHTQLLESCLKRRHEVIKKENTLYAIFDLTINLPSFDVFTFIILAEMRRRELGLDFIHFIVLPANSSDENTFSMNVLYDDEDFDWRIKNLILPAFQCLMSSVGVSKLANREELGPFVQGSNTFPINFMSEKYLPAPSISDLKYYIDSKKCLSHIQAPRMAKEAVEQFLTHINPNNKKIITLVLRELDTQLERNNDSHSWAKFSKSIDREKYTVIIVRDSYKCFEPINQSEYGNCHAFPLASADVTFRVALYEKSFMSLGVSSGALYPLYFIPNAKAIKFQMVSQTNPANAKRILEKIGLVENKDAFFRANRFQKLLWKNDSYLNISEAFKEMEKNLEDLSNVTKSKENAPFVVGKNNG